MSSHCLRQLSCTLLPGSTVKSLVVPSLSSLESADAGESSSSSELEELSEKSGLWSSEADDERNESVSSVDSITESTATGTFVTEPSISHTTSAAPLPTVFTKEPEQKEVFHWEPNAASLHRGCPSWSKQVAFAFTRSPALSFDIVTCPTSWSHNSKTLNGAWPGYHVALHCYTMYHWATKCPTRRTTYYRDRLTFVSSYRQDRKVYLCPTGRTTGRSIVMVFQSRKNGVKSSLNFERS